MYEKLCVREMKVKFTNSMFIFKILQNNKTLFFAFYCNFTGHIYINNLDMCITELRIFIVNIYFIFYINNDI